MLITLCHIDLRCCNPLCINVMAIWMIVDNFSSRVLVCWIVY